MKHAIAILAALLTLAPPVYASSPCGTDCLEAPHVTRLPLVSTTVDTTAEMDTITRYLKHVYDDGDYLNDWLTHVRPSIRDALQALGQSIEGSRAGRFVFTVVYEGETSDQVEFLRGFTWASRNGYSAYQSMWIGVGEVLDNHLEESVMDSVWEVIEEQCVN